MKIYNKIVLSIETGEVLEEDFVEYHGPVDECKGGSTTTNTQDPEYNARMATIAEAQQSMAEEYFNFWKAEQKPLETEQVAAQRALLPQEQALAEGQIAASREITGLQMPVAREYYNQVNKGVNIQDEIGRAKTTAMQEYANVGDQWRREAGHMGVNPESGRYASLRGKMLRDQAKATAGAATNARRYAEKENFTRLQTAATGQ